MTSDIPSAETNLHPPSHQVHRFAPSLPGRRATHLRTVPASTPAHRALHHPLRARKVIANSQGDRLRFGFGIYHDQEDIDELCARLAAARLTVGLRGPRELGGESAVRGDGSARAGRGIAFW